MAVCPYEELLNDFFWINTNFQKQPEGEKQKFNEVQW